MERKPRRLEICRYTDAHALGWTDITDDQFAAYEAAAQQPEGLIKVQRLRELGILGTACDLEDNTTVYLI